MSFILCSSAKKWESKKKNKIWFWVSTTNFAREFNQFERQIKKWKWEKVKVNIWATASNARVHSLLVTMFAIQITSHTTRFCACMGLQKQVLLNWIILVSMPLFTRKSWSSCLLDKEKLVVRRISSLLQIWCHPKRLIVYRNQKKRKEKKER